MYTSAPRADTIAGKLVDASSCTVPLVSFVEHAVKKSALDKTEIGKRFLKLV